MEENSYFRNEPAAPRKEAGDIISHAFGNYKKIIGYAIVAAVVYFTVQSLAGGGNDPQMQQVVRDAMSGKGIDYGEVSSSVSPQMYTGAGVSLLFSLLMYPVFAGLLYMNHKSNLGQSPEFKDLFIGYKRNTLKLMLYPLVLSLIAFIGILVCFIPMMAGLALGAGNLTGALAAVCIILTVCFLVYFAMAGVMGFPALFFENTGIFTALKRGLQMTRENTSLLALTGVLAVLASLSGIVLCCVGIVLTYMFIFSAQYSAYCAINGVPEKLG